MGHTLTVGHISAVQGDVILGAMGIPISEEKPYDKIYKLLSGLRPGEAPTVTVLRDGEKKTLSVPMR